MTGPALRVAVLDDHPAMRAGVAAILAAAPGIVCVGAAASEAAVWPLLRRARPDVLLLDVDHPGLDGHHLCLRLRGQVTSPHVVLHLDVDSPEQVAAAHVAGAAAVVAKHEHAHTLLTAVRAAASGGYPPALAPGAATRVASVLDAADHAVLAMCLAGTAPDDIALTLGLTQPELRGRRAAIVDRLLAARGGGRARTAAPAPGLGARRPALVDAARLAGRRLGAR